MLIKQEQRGLCVPRLKTGFNGGMCSESDALIKTYVSSSLPSNGDLVHSAQLKVHKISESEWDSLVIKSELPVMVMFTANWCGPCRLIAPKYIAFDLEFTGRFKLYTVDIDEEQVMAERYGIRAMPTSIVFIGGEKVAMVVGANPSALHAVLEKYA
ncbi:Thioredoxin superfamily protein [Raphanus sativus]|uniref:Uncharacterized protein LOC108851747 isoform X2 n=1 Tax=Raphanus sativus TaxID=3726 RepID=A0A6J0N942_RAPSA|nr:uncharacterized protein LOC108851747 isoform X2 [Raphanus sativus]KAJ4899484.1 Thioredoxin superfamily protein [Raphanus sativus]